MFTGPNHFSAAIHCFMKLFLQIIFYIFEKNKKVIQGDIHKGVSICILKVIKNTLI